MCGIAGFVAHREQTNDSIADAVRRMSARMRRRGPDGEGFWTLGGAVLAHRRLAILDLDPRANQPMLSHDGRYVITFNGEIYNFRALRSELESGGIQFRTSSDTEVILALYARERENMLLKLRGMFALAIWDNQTRQLFLARDPYGIKPLYYSQLRDGFIFASQVKGLLASGRINSEIEPAGVTGFYLWGSVPEPWTLYRDVFALPAGHWLRVSEGRAGGPVCWKDIRTAWLRDKQQPSTGEAKASVREAMLDSVRAHLVSDVPVSVFLSGGIDSSVIAGMAAELGARVEGITIGFSEFGALHKDEVPIASRIASHYGLPHHIRLITCREFEEETPLILDAMDQPSIDGVNTWFASKAAAERGYKVVLSGVGGDEVFRGYSYTRQIPRHVRISRILAAIPGVPSLLKTPCRMLSQRRSSPKLKAVPEFMGTIEGAYFLKRGLFLPEELPGLMDPELATDGISRLGGTPPGISKANLPDPAAAVCLLDSSHYLRNQLLRDSDWASMAHSLELRTPLVDSALLDSISPLLYRFVNGTGKRLLAASPAKPLPEDVISRKKTGFGVPMAEWLNSQVNRQTRIDSPLLSSPRAPWARRWAKWVLDSHLESSANATPKSDLHAYAG